MRAALLAFLGGWLVASSSAAALTIRFEVPSADWPVDGVEYPRGFLRPQTDIVEAGSEVRIQWRGPLGETSFLGFEPRPGTIEVEPFERFALGTLRFGNFGTTTRGPLRLDLALTLESERAGPFQILVPFTLEETHNDVIDMAQCPEGSVSRCDDHLLTQRLFTGVGLEILGFGDLVDPIPRWLAPEDTVTGLDLVGWFPIPEPRSLLLVGVGLVSLALGLSRPRADRGRTKV